DLYQTQLRVIGTLALEFGIHGQLWCVVHACREVRQLVVGGNHGDVFGQLRYHALGFIFINWCRSCSLHGLSSICCSCVAAPRIYLAARRSYTQVRLPIVSCCSCKGACSCPL